MSLFFSGNITNVDNGTSTMTPIAGYAEYNAFDHILYVCIRIFLTFQHSVSCSSVICRPVVGLVRHFLRNLSLAHGTFLAIPPSSDYTVCVYGRMRTYQSLLYVPAFALTHCASHSFYSSNPSAHRPSPPIAPPITETSAKLGAYPSVRTLYATTTVSCHLLPRKQT